MGMKNTTRSDMTVSAPGWGGRGGGVAESSRHPPEFPSALSAAPIQRKMLIQNWCISRNPLTAARMKMRGSPAPSVSAAVGRFHYRVASQRR